MPKLLSFRHVIDAATVILMTCREQDIICSMIIFLHERA